MVPAMTWKHPTGRAPESVAILGLGGSKHDFFESLIPHGFVPPWHEVWGINCGIRFPHDVLWVMDDLEKELTRYPTDQYPNELRMHHKPIISSKAHADVLTSYTYPLQEVADYWGRWPSMPRSSVPAILAYAGFIGVRSLYLYGIDYAWGDARREPGATWVAFWLGRLLERGVKINITESSTMLDTRERMSDPDYVAFYGYARPPKLVKK